MRAHFFDQSKTAFLLVWGIAVSASGGTVFYDDINRGPDNSLNVGGIHAAIPPWLSPPQPPGQVATVGGFGLGSSAVGPISSIDVRMHYNAGESLPDQTAYEALVLDVQGVFESITIVPRLLVSGGTGSMSPFYGVFTQFSSDPDPHWTLIDPSNLVPITISRSSFVECGPTDYLTIQINMNPSNGGGPGWFLPYRAQNNLEETLEFGFTIQSVTYAVPEPGPAALALVGLLGLWRAKRGGARLR